MSTEKLVQERDELQPGVPKRSSDALAYWVVDSFASRSQLGSGNPAAIVLLKQDDPKIHDPRNKSCDSSLPRSKEWMQKVATEFNLSETAFCWPKPRLPALSEAEGNNDMSASNSDASGPAEWNILYFAPAAEVALCGHATLAAAHVVASTITKNKAEITFYASKDTLKTTVTVEAAHESIVTMEFPALPPNPYSGSDRSAIADMVQEAFHIAPTDILYIGLSSGLGDVLVEVTKESFFQIGYSGLKISALEIDVTGYTRGVIVCCCDPLSASVESDGGSRENTNSSTSDSMVDFWSRFFCPKTGVPEDPVTGSAHCALAPYFGQKLNKPCVVGKQMSARSGVVECVWKPDDQLVHITGNTITMMHGTLLF